MYSFVRQYPADAGDAIALPNLSSVTDFTICCYFNPIDYGGFTGASGSYPSGFAQAVTGTGGFGSPTGAVMFYRLDTGAANSTAVASFAGAGNISGSLTRPPRNSLHSMVIVRTGTSTTFWLNGLGIYTTAVGAGAITLDNIRIGCKENNANNGNEEFVFAQMGQWALFTRAWSSTEVNTYHTARTSSINRLSETMFSLLGISTTGLADYRPLVDDVEDHSGNGRSQTVIGAPTFGVAGARVRSANFTPAGDLLLIRFEKSSDSSAANVTAFGGGLTITKNGGAPIAITDGHFSTHCNFLWAPTDKHFLAKVNCNDSVNCVKAGGGTWEDHTERWDGRSSYEYRQNDVTGKVNQVYAGIWQRNTTTSATVVYTFSVLIPGDYEVFTIIPAHSTNTSNATFTVREGSTVRATLSVNMRQDTRFDAQEDGKRWMRLGTAAIAGTTATVTIVNLAADGALAINSIWLRRLIKPFMTGADTVTVSAPLGWATCGGNDVQAAVNVPVTRLTDDQYLPFNPGRTRNLKIGYNVGFVNNGPLVDKPNAMFTNWARRSGGWQGSGINLDALGNLTLNPSGATLSVADLPTNNHNGVDNTAYPNHPSHGDWWVRCKIGTGSIASVNIESITHFESPFPVNGTRMAMADEGPWKVFKRPIDHRATPDNACNVRVTVAAGTTVLDIEIYDPGVDHTTWTSKFHPAFLNPLKDHGFETIRFLDWYNCISSNSHVEWPDFPLLGKVGLDQITTYRDVNVTAIGPADFSNLDDPAGPYRWFFTGTGQGVALVTTSGPHGLRTGDFCEEWSSPLKDNGYADTGTLPTISVNFDGQQPVVVKDSTHFWVRVHSDSPVSAVNASLPITMAATTSLTATGTFRTGRGASIEDAIDLCNEANVNAYICWPVAISDAALAHFAALIATRMNPARKIYNAISNETWNPGFISPYMTALFACNAQWLWDHPAVPDTLGQKANCGRAVGRAWLMHRTHQMRTIFRTAFTAAARPLTDIITVLEGCWADASIVGTSANYAAAAGFQASFDRVALAPYTTVMDMDTVGSGYPTNPYAALMDMSAEARVDLNWLNIGPDSPQAGQWAANRGALTAAGIDPATKPFITYEGGTENVGRGQIQVPAGISGADQFRAGNDDWHTFMCGHMNRLELAKLQYWDETLGVTLENRYTLNQSNGNGQSKFWMDFPTYACGVGTGDPAENPNPFNFDPDATTPIVSQVGGARRFWASGAAVVGTTPKPANPGLVTGNALVSGLIRCIPFHESSGSTLNDLSTGHLGMTTRSGGSTTVLTRGTDSDPKVSRYVTFDGINDDAMGVDTGFVVSNTPFTFAFLIRTTSSGSALNFSGYGSPGTFDSIAFGRRSDNGVVCARTPGASTGGPSTPVLNDGQWHLVTITYLNPNFFTFYMDGSLVYADATGVATAPTLSGNWFLGRGPLTGSEGWLACDIAGAWAWNRILSAGELTSFQADRWQMLSEAATLAAGLAAFVSSGPAGVVVTSAVAVGGTSPYTYQWQRNTDGGTYANLSGAGVGGATTLTLTDGDATAGHLYGYRLVATDAVSAMVTGNAVTAEIYTGGPLVGGGGGGSLVNGGLVS